MKLYGKLIKNRKIIKETVFDNKDESMSYRDALEQCLIGVCRELDVPVPMWLKNNTSEFIHYKKTSFTVEHFVEKINFERLEIRVE